MSKALQRQPPILYGPLTADEGDRKRFRDEFAAFLADLESEASQRAYAYDWGLWQRWLSESRDRPPDVATTGDVQQFLLALREGSYRTLKNGDLGSPLGRSTRQRVLSVLRAVYGVFVRADLMYTNPAREAKNVKKASADPKTPWFGADTIRALIRAARDLGNGWRARRNRSMMFILLGMGIRRTEVARIRIGDIFFQEKQPALTLTVKGGKREELPIPKWVWDEVGEWMPFAGESESDPLFPKNEGDDRHVSESTVYNVVKKVAKKADVDPKRIAPHALRRSYITETGRRGVSLKARQHSVGHVSQKTTEIYDKATTLFEEIPGDSLADLADEGEEES